MITFRTLGKLGRFGNQLFQYAGTRLYAEQNGYTSAIPNWIGTKIFSNIQHWTGVEQIRATLLPTIQLEDMAATSWPERLLRPVGFWQRSSMTRLWNHPQDNINLYGYMQDEQSLSMLRKYSNLVRSWFLFKSEIEKKFRAATDQFRPWLAVHVRRGDMVKRNKIMDMGEYTQHIERLVNGRQLYIASDDASVRSQFASFNPIAPHNPLPEIEKAYFDFWMLRESDTLIGSGSTFAWWAAFLGNQDYWAPPLNHTWVNGAPDITHQHA